MRRPSVGGKVFGAGPSLLAPVLRASPARISIGVGCKALCVITPAAIGPDHPALVEQFTVVEGELMVKRDGQTSILHAGETSRQ